MTPGNVGWVCRSPCVAATQYAYYLRHSPPRSIRKTGAASADISAGLKKSERIPYPSPARQECRPVRQYYVRSLMQAKQIPSPPRRLPGGGILNVGHGTSRKRVCHVACLMEDRCATTGSPLGFLRTTHCGKKSGGLAQAETARKA